MPNYQGTVRRCTVCGRVVPTYAKLKCQRCYHRELYRHHRDKAARAQGDTPRPPTPRKVSTPEAFREMWASLQRFAEELGI